MYPFLCSANAQLQPESVSYPNCIVDTQCRLYVGAESHAFDAKVIGDLRITHVLNVTGKPTKLEASIAQSLQYMTIKMEDEAHATHFDKSSTFVEDALTANATNRVLIHCGGGKSRATTFAMAYLIKYRRQSFAFAYGTVQSVRPKTFPNDGFVDDLSEYEVKNRGSSTKQFVVQSKLRDKETRQKILQSWDDSKNNSLFVL
mmetsp:Transcript_8214/g.12729  ORF Transcript_8214/g.12729 Transcript_8214/m.12729 type:complete len:202 (-) Transcript_8214:3-608(-)